MLAAVISTSQNMGSYLSTSFLFHSMPHMTSMCMPCTLARLKCGQSVKNSVFDRLIAGAT